MRASISAVFKIELLDNGYLRTGAVSSYANGLTFVCLSLRISTSAAVGAVTATSL